ncbi:MAG: RICIN domain-containing protein [Gordonibacter sp.]|nr:RICIN domain-containing protein [Gordonibacter sp.]
MLLGVSLCLPSVALAVTVDSVADKGTTAPDQIIPDPGNKDPILSDDSDEEKMDESAPEAGEDSGIQGDNGREFDHGDGGDVAVLKDKKGKDAVESASDASLNSSGENSSVVSCPIAEGAYLIKSAVSATRVLDVAGGSFYDGALIQLWTSNMSSAQRFKVSVGSDGYAVISNIQSGKVLDVVSASKESGTPVWQYASNDSKAQKWHVVANNDGTYALESALRAGLVLDISGASDCDGSKLQVYEANDSKAQKFSFVGAVAPAEGGRTIADGIYEINSVLAAEKSLDISAASINNGAIAQIYNSNHSLAQRFLVQMDEEGFYHITAVHSGKSLDVNQGNLIPGAKVHQWDTNGNNNNQRWIVRQNDDGSVSFICRSNAQALDVRWGDAANGTPLQAYTDNGSAAQRWNLVSVESLLDEGYYSIKSKVGSGRSLDISAGSASGGANLQLWSWNGSAAQRFKLRQSDEKGVYTIEVLCSGHRLTQRGNNVVQAAEAVTNAADQQWRLVASGSGGVSFVNNQSGLALDVSGAGDWDGNNIGAYKQNGTASQAFMVEKVNVIGNGTFVLRSSGGCALDVAAGSRANGANVQVYEYNDSGAQKWNLRSVENGLFVVENARSKKVLDVAERSAVPGTNVQQWETANSLNQFWRVDYIGGGKYSLVSALGNLSLTVDGNGSSNGQNVTIRTTDGSASQQFRLDASTYVPENFSDKIASFTTYSTNSYAGTYNMQRALNSFNGYVIWPGQTMSFFGVAGPCGAAQGYLLAGVVGGSGYGGGICQSSTTLYGASIRAGLTIVERRNHSVPSTYVPIGLDAMVDFGSSDFRVRNDFDFPVKIVTNTPGNTLQVDIYGIQPEWFDYIEPRSWWTGLRSAAAQRTYYKNGQAIYVEGLRDSFY